MLSTWPKQSRPREKLIQHGAESLTDAELLAIVLRTGVRGQSAVHLAEQLLQQCESLAHLLHSDFSTVRQVKGIGAAKFAQIAAVREIAERSLKQTLSRKSLLNNSLASADYLQGRMRHYQHEVFACLLLDTRHQLIRYQELFKGSLNGASVYPREVVKCVLEANAAAVILAHNHPSGDCQPSQADKHITQRLRQALGLIDVTVLDHIIVGHSVYSMADNHLI
ncbi:MAG: hypothetical protein CBC79_04250 [Gammaproteobacteria bacterium TMED119]|nr:MAG: hypothetical protein CBC79_04250 [Gammaproteobacteria bacterium TMED119]|tara:strand:- start:371 stop:1039 length:669 start_codon:yes stop_codon:yes gene_type:complete